MNNYKIDLYDYLVWLKQTLQIERVICNVEGNPSKFETFECVLDNI